MLKTQDLEYILQLGALEIENVYTTEIYNHSTSPIKRWVINNYYYYSLLHFQLVGKPVVVTEEKTRKMKLKNVDNKDDFVKYMANIVWSRNSFMDFSESISLTPCRLRCNKYSEMNPETVLTVAKKVGMEQEVIVFLARKLFEYIFEKNPEDSYWSQGPDRMVCMCILS
jgi:hypothetical protein